MIKFNDVYQAFRTPNGLNHVARGINTTFPTGVSVALLGKNGAGKSTLMKMIGGGLTPDRGSIDVGGSISWPVGFSGNFHRDLSGMQNTRFVARVYGVNTEELTDFVEDFSELGDYFHVPVRNYSSGMKSRLAFGISIGIPFDTYLVDEVTAVGDAAFKRKSRLVLQERLKTSGAVVVTHYMSQVRLLCTAGAILHDGSLTYYEDLEEAIAQHQSNLGSTED